MRRFIRPAAPEDAARLAEIEIFNYRLYFYPIFRTDKYFFTELTVPALVDEYSASPEKITRTLVYDDGIVKAFVRVNGDEIEKLFVEPCFHCMGIGSALLQFAIEERGGRHLLVLEKNPRAIRLYERNGFVCTDERRMVDDTDEYFIIMRHER